MCLQSRRSSQEIKRSDLGGGRKVIPQSDSGPNRCAGNPPRLRDSDVTRDADRGRRWVPPPRPKLTHRNIPSGACRPIEAATICPSEDAHKVALELQGGAYNLWLVVSRTRPAAQTDEARLATRGEWPAGNVPARQCMVYQFHPQKWGMRPGAGRTICLASE